MSDTASLAVLLVSFATLVTAHLAIAYGLTHRTPWWRGPVALVVVLLAPYWALRSRMYVRAAAWLLAAIVYLIARR